MVGQGLIIFGGPAIGLVTINHYPFLIEDRTLYSAGLASIVFWFLASFAIYGKKYFPKGMPPLLKLPFRAGFGLCMSFLLLGAAGIVNGYGMPMVSRDVAVVSKHTTRHSDPLIGPIIWESVRGHRRPQSWSLARRVRCMIVFTSR